MEIQNCYFITRYDKDEAKTQKNLIELIETVKKIPLVINGGWLKVEGGETYLRITPDSVVDINEVKISQGGTEPKVKDFYYDRGKNFISFNYKSTRVDIDLKSKEKILEEKIMGLEQRLKSKL